MLTLNCFCWCLYTKKVRVVHSQLANECLLVSYGFLPSILQVWVAEGWQVCITSLLNICEEASQFVNCWMFSGGMITQLWSEKCPVASRPAFLR